MDTYILEVSDDEYAETQMNMIPVEKSFSRLSKGPIFFEPDKDENMV